MSINKPRFKRLYHVEHVPGAGTFLLEETNYRVLNGRLHDLVTPLITGAMTVDEIADSLADKASPAEIYYTINVLEQRGLIEDAESDIPVHAAAWWQSLGIDPHEAAVRLEANPVAVRPLGDVPMTPVIDALVGAGVRVQDDARLVVAVVDDHRNPGLDELDRLAIEANVPWAIIKPTGHLAWIGPFFDPRVPGCWACLLDRLNMNYTVDTFITEYLRRDRAPITSKGWTSASVGMAANLGAMEIARWIARRGESDLINTILTFNGMTTELNRHKVTWRPQCPRCGEAVYREGKAHEREPRPLVLESRQRRFEVDGGSRTATPEETLEKYRDQISPITGAVSRLDRISPPDKPLIHAYAASHNWATHPDSLAFLKHSLRSNSGGKGKTDIQARVGALAEAMERYSGVYRGDEIRRNATLEAMGPAAIHPYDVMLFSERQYAEREQINSVGDSFQMVPYPFLPEAPVDWSPMWSPTREEFRWLPTGLLYYSQSKAIPHDTPNRLAYYADSNGCAAGNSIEEAALQGLMELVERDAVATWWYNQVQRPAVDIDEIDDPWLDQLRRWLDKTGRTLWVLDITNDIGIPTFAAVSHVRSGVPSERVVVGFGAHVDPMVGIMRAITEVNQFFASLDALGDDGLGKAFDPGAVEWWQTATLENKPYLVPLDVPPARIRDLANTASEDIREELLSAIRTVESRDLQVLILDQTRPDTGFPVAKVLVPGMRHFWRRVAPGRLYDVPVRMGWQDRALTEDELNPTPVFF